MKYGIHVLTALTLATLLMLCANTGSAQTIIREADGRFGYDTAAHQEVQAMIIEDSAKTAEVDHLTAALNDYKKTDLDHQVKEKNLQAVIDECTVTVNKITEAIKICQATPKTEIIENPDWWKFAGGGVIVGALITVATWLLVHK